MKLGIIALILGILGIVGYLSIVLSSTAVRFETIVTPTGYDVVYFRDWAAGWLSAAIGLSLILLGIFRLKRTRAKRGV